MIYGFIIGVLALVFVVLFFKWMFTKPVKVFYSIVREADANGVEIFKLYIQKGESARQYIGKFDNFQTAKEKITALKEKAAKDLEATMGYLTADEVYREDM